jgi:NTE family protein
MAGPGMSKPRIGLALGSGAARGWAHIGVIERLREDGVEPDIVCGSSIGALVGAAYVRDKLPELKSFAEQLTWRGVVKLLDIGFASGGLVSGKLILEFLRNLGVTGPIEDCPKPFGAVASDLETGREVWLREGPLEEAVRASISIPGVLSPYRINERWLADGALVNPVPVSLCRAMGADVVIAVHLNGDGAAQFRRAPVKREEDGASDFVRGIVAQTPAVIKERAAALAAKFFPPPQVSPGYFDVLLNSINIMQDLITRARLAGEPPHVLLTPRLSDMGGMDFDQAKQAIAEGAASAEAALPVLRRYL